MGCRGEARRTKANTQGGEQQSGPNKAVAACQIEFSIWTGQN